MVLELKNIYKTYIQGKLEVPVLKDVCFEMEDGELTHLELLPVELGFGEPRYRLGNPRVSTDRGIIERYAEMSEKYGTKISIDERGIGIVEL
jgi:poly-gamma-glutamate synthesis protein (capsule biosynthesis protein)